MTSKKIKKGQGWEVWKSKAKHTGTGQEVEFVNVSPRFGTKHIGSPDCWCDPDIKENGILLIHNSDN